MKIESTLGVQFDDQPNPAGLHQVVFGPPFGHEAPFMFLRPQTMEKIGLMPADPIADEYIVLHVKRRDAVAIRDGHVTMKLLKRVAAQIRKVIG